MKKILVMSALLALGGCYSAAPTAQDVYVEPYVAPTVYYTYPAENTATYVMQNNVPTTTYIIEEESPDVVYINPEPAYVYLDNPLIYGRPHRHHFHHARHTASEHMSHHARPHQKHHQGKPASLVK